MGLGFGGVRGKEAIHCGRMSQRQGLGHNVGSTGVRRYLYRLRTDVGLRNTG